MTIGSLQKLRIQAYADVKYEQPKGEAFEVLFNPATYQQKYEIEYVDSQAPGTTGTPKKLGKIKPQKFNMELLFDGTGASGPKIEVHNTVKQFIDLCYKMDGEEHRHSYLHIVWGKLSIKGVLESAQVTYTLFRPDGTPLRAKIAAVFEVAVDETLRVAIEGKTSPDLTHLREVIEGDTLPLMSHRIYGDPAYYLAVARYNGLTHTKTLQPGQRLAFPPVVDLDSTLIPAKTRG